jgi:hypothetical protein
MDKFKGKLKDRVKKPKVIHFYSEDEYRRELIKLINSAKKEILIIG